MEKPAKIIRRSIYTLLKDFHYFTNNPVILLLPFSVSLLLFRSTSSHQSFLVPRLRFLDFNPCQLILSYVFSLPFALSSLIIAKASIIQYLDQKTTISSLYRPLLLTYLCGILLTIIISIAAYVLLLVASYSAEGIFGLSSKNHVFVMALGVVFYMVLTNTMIICNLSLVVAGMDNCNSYKAIQKACLLRKCTNSIALLLAFPINLGLAAIESLFQHRIVRAYHLFGRIDVSMIVEGLLIAYMFSLLIVLDTIICCFFIKSCYSQFELAKQSSPNSDSLQSLDEIA
ncbi:uncharacterized protein LOC8283438 [Ricinus communis]|uniref:uncharacterized protein LOC8283438 n=1 Tax=Ricinus communis TaxID=3988 RepID=UPI00201AF1BD|nr:uncharacterized protein LOC8283438 [Ricinus communis]